MMIGKTAYRRYFRAKVGYWVFKSSAYLGVLILLILGGTIVNQIFGLRAVEFEIEPSTLTNGRPLDTLSSGELSRILVTNVPEMRPLVLIRDELLDGSETVDFTKRTISDLFSGRLYPEDSASKSVRDLTQDEIIEILSLNLSPGELVSLVNKEVVGLIILESWNLSESLFNREAIDAKLAKEYPKARLEPFSLLTWQFLTSPMSSDPVYAGVRTAILGSLWGIGITIFCSLPIGFGCAVYLAEYAEDNWWNRFIETNIRTLSGVPSIIFGLLGVFVFNRVLAPITGGRTILSAGLTLAILVIPLIVINTIEALRAVPSGIREASYRTGATKWQTIQFAVLRPALPGILTGIILATARALGETAPLIVVGASTYITKDPTGLWSSFTALPIQIYEWSKRPQGEFHSAAAAAIAVLLVMGFSLNLFAIVLREYFSRSVRL